MPGLYHWWADETAATDLSKGLDELIEPGMIYAGLAGATRWPSGKRSTNTSWSRLAGMHLGERHEFWTFRRSLGAIHARRVDASIVDEDALTEWMRPTSACSLLSEKTATLLDTSRRKSCVSSTRH